MRDIFSRNSWLFRTDVPVRATPSARGCVSARTRTAPQSSGLGCRPVPRGARMQCLHDPSLLPGAAVCKGRRSQHRHQRPGRRGYTARGGIHSSQRHSGGWCDRSFHRARSHWRRLRQGTSEGSCHVSVLLGAHMSNLDREEEKNQNNEMNVKAILNFH